SQVAQTLTADRPDRLKEETHDARARLEPPPRSVDNRPRAPIEPDVGVGDCPPRGGGVRADRRRKPRPRSDRSTPRNFGGGAVRAVRATLRGLGAERLARRACPERPLGLG